MAKDASVSDVAKQAEVPVPNLNPQFRPQQVKKAALVLVIILVVSIGVFLATRGQGSEIAQADQAFKAGNYDRAIEGYKKGLQKDENNPKLIAATIRTLASKGSTSGKESETFDDAKPYIDAGLNVGGQDPSVLSAIGYAYETDGQYQPAFKYYSQALALDQSQAKYWFQHGHVLEFLGRRQEAYVDYEKAYELDKNNPQILMARAGMLLAQGKTQEVFETYKQAADIPGISSVTRAEALTGASLIRATQDDYLYVGEAVKLSEEAVNASPNFSPALAAHGYNLYLTEPTTAKGFEFLKKAIDANPKISRNYFLLGTFYRADHDYSTAIQYLQEAVLRADSDNTVFSGQDRRVAKGRYTYELAKTYSKSGLSYDVLSLIKEALTLDPNIKTKVRDDVLRGDHFKDLQSNPEFIALTRD